MITSVASSDIAADGKIFSLSEMAGQTLAAK
jgi:hypothetical protein